jgi:4'-phosphopantetheinyl transferase EntD
VGIDAELVQPLDDGVISHIANAEELLWLEGHRGDPRWPIALFSAKEAIYKAWFALMRTWLGFHDAVVQVNEATGAFSAHLLVPGPVVGGARLSRLDGRLAVDVVRALSAVAVPSGGTSAPAR